MCRVWDDVKHPIGTIQITIKSCDGWNRYLYLIRALNDNGYIVYGTTRAGEHKEENIAIYIKEKHRLPVYLIASEENSHKIQNLTTNTDVFDGIISVAEKHDKYSLIQTLKHFISWQTPKLSEHVPILVINGMSDFITTNKTLAKELHNTYINYHPEKLTIVLYPDTNSETLIGTEKQDIKKEILSFLGTIQNKK